MSAMHAILVGATALAVMVLAVGGAAGVTTGWVPPWGRPRILRPRLWGYGSLVTAAGATVWAFVGPLKGPPHGASVYVAWTGWVVFMAGLLVQLRARRPGRVPRLPPPTTTVS
ncbi:hypothetical protein [Streptomyces sp. FL07-04A]|uniref:hypothetical protein n=1 Tax=Streptomyces sp. FL07-04A TaxID=3028658 RepID=UPI0029AFEE73|nr:hypothetical protein [Streptomyces sp. FL07-04A]MDX3578987.1 hypothetical protein [Streptomyces sp. FL07-04A]